MSDTDNGLDKFKSIIKEFRQFCKSRGAVSEAKTRE